MKLSQTDPIQRRGKIAYIDKRWAQLAELERTGATDAIKYIFMVNSGAAVAMLAFLGTSATIRALLWPKIMLGFFVAGVAILGFYHAARYHKGSGVFKGWRKDVNTYYEDKMDWNDLLAQDNQRSTKGILPQIALAYIAFSCFLIGVIIGLCNFSNLTN